MNKVYLHRRLAKDEYLGRVDANGKVYETRLGPDRYVGRVELESGKIYEGRTGPDRYMGRVEAETGKVFISKLGPDEYLGRVEADGKLYLHKKLATDEYLGKVDEMASLVHGGAAFLLLIEPVRVEEAEKARTERADEEVPDTDADQPAAAPA